MISSSVSPETQNKGDPDGCSAMQGTQTLLRPPPQAGDSKELFSLSKKISPDLPAADDPEQFLPFKLFSYVSNVSNPMAKTRGLQKNLE